MASRTTTIIGGVVPPPTGEVPSTGPSSAAGGRPAQRRRALRVILKAASISEFLDVFVRFVDETSIIVSSSELPPLGASQPFLIALKNQQVVMRGAGEVMAVRPASNATSRGMIRLKILQLDDLGQDLHRQLLAKKKTAPAASPAPTAQTIATAASATAASRTTQSIPPAKRIPTPQVTARPAPPPLAAKLPGLKDPPSPPVRSPSQPPSSGSASSAPPTSAGQAPAARPLPGMPAWPASPGLQGLPTMPARPVSPRLGSAPATNVEDEITQVRNLQELRDLVPETPRSTEQRAPGSEFTLPANPFGSLSDETLEAFIDCTLYEEHNNLPPKEPASDESATEFAARYHSNEQTTIPAANPASVLAAAFSTEAAGGATQPDAPPPPAAVSAPPPEAAAPEATAAAPFVALNDAVPMAVPIRDAISASAPAPVVAGVLRADPTAKTDTLMSRPRRGISPGLFLVSMLIVAAAGIIGALMFERGWRFWTKPTPAARAIVPGDDGNRPPLDTAPPPTTDTAPPPTTDTAPPPDEPTAGDIAVDQQPTDPPVDNPVIEDDGNCRASFSTEPDAARVKVDGKLVGKTPLENLSVPCDQELSIHISRARYRSVEHKLTATRSAPIRSLERLARPQGVLRLVSNPPGAKVSVDGTPRGKTPAAVKLPQFSPVIVTGTLDGYKLWTRRMQVTKSEQTVKIELLPIPR